MEKKEYVKIYQPPLEEMENVQLLLLNGCYPGRELPNYTMIYQEDIDITEVGMQRTGAVLDYAKQIGLSSDKPKSYTGRTFAPGFVVEVGSYISNQTVRYICPALWVSGNSSGKGPPVWVKLSDQPNYEIVK